MKTKSLLLVTMLLCIISTFGQKPMIDLTFTAVNGTVNVPLDSIKVMNRTHYPYTVDTVIYWPDTTLTLEITPGDLLLYIGYSTGYPVGVQEINQENKQFQLFQNYPNPVYEQSTINMYIPKKGTVNIMITDIQGRLVIANDWQLNKGNHSFRFTGGGSNNLFFFTARWNGITRSIKILTTGQLTEKICMLDYIVNWNGDSQSKTVSLKKSLIMQESGILDTTITNKTYTFQFATNIPCQGTPTVTYEGQVYNTIQLFSQCWFKENLNVGTMINGSLNQTNNNILEKYCYNDNPDSCTKYGGLYQWDEMMQYTTQQGVQGICPPGWHLPTDEEWKVLEGVVDSQYGIGDNIWDILGDHRGYDAGMNLKTISGWYENGNGTDLFGFSGLPGGNRYLNGSFDDVGDDGSWWTSTEGSSYAAWRHSLLCYYQEVGRYNINKGGGFSVRCLRDN